ncbi:MAG: type II toxin-antitoxin system HicB family antitoxin [Actinomycetota bacterium]|nr:type II toxin-antitoxin system HicB family antitoxin [Actinomycetota bacterium]
MSTYRVQVTREDGRWLADVVGLRGAHTYARTLATLERYVREVIVLAADLEESMAEGLQREFDIATGDPQVDEATAAVRDARSDMALAAGRLQENTSRTARALVQAGWSVRDAAVVLKLSPQRVSQLTSSTGDRRAKPRTGTERAVGTANH